MRIDGACHYGLISFSAEVDPSRVMVCHCTDCQVLSGAPFRAVVAAPENATSVVIRLGCVTQRAEPVPSVQIWQRSSVPWLSELHRIDGSPEQQAFLPPQPPAAT